jgi:hypothetical protein
MPSLNEDQERSKHLIERAVEDAVRRNPEEVSVDDVRRELGDVEVRGEMMGGVFNTMRQRGLLERLGTRTSQSPGMKNRRITTYQATAKLLQELGVAPPVAVAEAGETARILEQVYAYAQSIGFICDIVDIANFYLCLRSKPFVVLSGISGTGKSLLPRIFAQAVGAEFVSIPVKPNWTDNSSLMGYFSVTHDDFVAGEMTKAIGAAVGAPDKLFIVRLDEMNLAHVEHYLSDLLSVMESRRRDSDRVVRTDPIPLDLPDFIVARDAAQRERWNRLARTYLPSNFVLVGTVNVDETTHPFSRKVLDRANTIDFSDVDLGAFGSQQSDIEAPSIPISTSAEFFLARPQSIQEVYGEDKLFFDEIAAKLEEVNNYLRDADLHFAYRVRDEVCLYMWAWRSRDLRSILSEHDAFDLCLMQKVLPRCQGSTETGRRVLERLFHFTCGSAPADASLDVEQLDADHPEAGRLYRRSAQKILRMLRRYRDTGFFSYWVA